MKYISSNTEEKTRPFRVNIVKNKLQIIDGTMTGFCRCMQITQDR